MAETQKISLETRHHIIALHKIGHSNRHIARELKMSNRTVDYIVKKFKDDGTIADKKRSGRPRTTSIREDRIIASTSKRNRRLTAPEIAAGINRVITNPISVTTVKRRLREAGLYGRIALKKPILRAENKTKRLNWATKYKNFTTNDWCKVLWSDESKFEVFGSSRRVYVRRSAGERAIDQCLVPRIKHGGGSIMVWGCFAGVTVGDLHRIDGILDKHQYKMILQERAIPTGTKILGDNFIFQQDNDPKHTAKICKEYLNSQEANGICTVMDWPAQSPDLNPIELLWDELDRAVRKTCPTSKEDLWNKLKEAWSSISAETLLKLIERMPRLCAAVIAKKGGHIDESNI